MTNKDYNAIKKSFSDSESVAPKNPTYNTPISDSNGESKTEFLPPDAHYDFRDGVAFKGSWPGKELVHFIHDTIVDFYDSTVISDDETVKLSKSDIIEFSIREKRQTEKALEFLEAYDVVDYHREGRKVYYSYNQDSAKDYEIFEAMGALNSIDVRNEFLEERRQEAKETYLNRVTSN
ncbi:hypothetical protein ACERIT_08965 [Halopenitus sp. H-Gu1]|uniref:hypothetical protein n=1 Tax=Halopenitus sp. H-Gu1 TaxID=3242697 RepID=UPI00359E8022